jgi:chromosome partitioning protein
VRAKTISVVNMKGGVGKTTVSVALAETLASVFDLDTVVIDLDAQASCTFALLGEGGFERMKDDGRHSVDFFRDMRPGEIPELLLDDYLTQPASRLDPVPPLALMGSRPELQALEREIIVEHAKAGFTAAAIGDATAAHLRAGLDSVRNRLDVVLIDCPPGVSSFTEAAIRCSDLVIAPVTPDYLPALGLEAFLFQAVQPLRRQGLFKGRLQVLFNRIESRPDQQRFIDLITSVADDFGDVLKVFETRLPQSRDMARAVEPAEGLLTFEAKYGSASPLLRELAQETLEALDRAEASAHAQVAAVPD